MFGIFVMMTIGAKTFPVGWGPGGLGSVFERMETNSPALRMAVSQLLEYTITISALSIEFEASQSLN